MVKKMVKIIPIILIIIAIIFVSIGISISVGFSKVVEIDNNLPQVNDGSIIDPSDSTTTITSEVIQLESGSAASTLKISGEALSCTLTKSERIVDLRIINYEEVIKSITISPVGRKVILEPKQILRVFIPISDGIENLILYSDEKVEDSILVPPCATEGYSSLSSSSSSFSQYDTSPFGTQIEPPNNGPGLQPPTEDPVTAIPEFPSIVLPVLSLIAIMFVMQKRK